MKHFKLFLIAFTLVALVSAKSAFATGSIPTQTVNLGQLTLNDPYITFGKYSAAQNNKTFEEIYSFTTPTVPSQLSATALNFKTSVTNITGLTLKLVGPHGLIETATAVNNVASLNSLYVAAGSHYSVEVFGTTGRLPAGSVYNIDIVASAPEPATWAMMIIGFGAVGFMFWSRRNAGAPTVLAA